jgi:hypothetical protein
MAAQKNIVKSEYMIITVKHNKDIEVQYKKNGNPKKLPKIGERHPDNPDPIEAEDGTQYATPIATIKYHHHSDCITLDLGGGAVYQICWP